MKRLLAVTILGSIITACGADEKVVEKIVEVEVEKIVEVPAEQDSQDANPVVPTTEEDAPEGPKPALEIPGLDADGQDAMMPLPTNLRSLMTDSDNAQYLPYFNTCTQAPKDIIEGDHAGYYEIECTMEDDVLHVSMTKNAAVYRSYNMKAYGGKWFTIDYFVLGKHRKKNQVIAYNGDFGVFLYETYAGNAVTRWKNTVVGDEIETVVSEIDFYQQTNAEQTFAQVHTVQDDGSFLIEIVDLETTLNVAEAVGEIKFFTSTPRNSYDASWTMTVGNTTYPFIGQWKNTVFNLTNLSVMDFKGIQ